jgi:SAM-dependent methyltransferase
LAQDRVPGANGKWGDAATTARLAFDGRYLQRSPEINRRHYFPFVASRVVSVCARPQQRIVDVGCATGELLELLANELEPERAVGVDLSRDLLAEAAARYPGLEFRHGDVTDPASLPPGKFDVATMCTLHSHFDEPGEWLPGFLQLLAPSGTGFVFGPFNDVPVDVAVRMRYAGGADPWLCGWSVQSKHSVSAWLDRFSKRRHAFEPYRPAQPRPAGGDDDPLRSTLSELGGTMAFNVAGTLQMTFSLLVIR